MTKYYKGLIYDPLDVVVRMSYQKIKSLLGVAFGTSAGWKRISLTIGREKYSKIII
ncbi:MAG: hypothetical protein M3263_00290 [Thermoproteota archaeon]|nr:hypothetical protein [Thermoproteota archaeon]